MTDLQKRKIKRLYRRGYLILFISISVGVSQSTVRRVINKSKKKKGEEIW